MKKRFCEEQIIGFLREAEAGMPVKELYCAQVLRLPVDECHLGAPHAVGTVAVGVQADGAHPCVDDAGVLSG